MVLVRLSSPVNGIDITEAIWFSAGRLPAIRALGSAVPSVIVAGMGVSLGRGGAPKLASAAIASHHSGTRVSRGIDHRTRVTTARSSCHCSLPW
ncbi:hypothetical protein BSU04_22685 [Caballeronia sordidicola]|uniref:Uncharacterized protein n=1 Tax=Caballeronia sordidicola TaxID=196367 RepID=A0A226WYL3_CABSO|nr:hypothetical protein BSU04_22685 [Caballeronia sordidicola]